VSELGREGEERRVRIKVERRASTAGVDILGSKGMGEERRGERREREGLEVVIGVGTDYRVA